MNLLPVDETLLRLGEPLPVSLWDARGVLLLPRGALIQDDAQRRRLAALGPQVHAHDHDRIRKPWLLAMEAMVLRNETLGKIAELQPGEVASTPSAAPVAAATEDLAHRWNSLRMRLGNTLRDPQSKEFRPRLMRDAQALIDLLREDADGSLLVLLHDAARDPRDHGPRHSLVVAAIAALVAIEQSTVWPQDDIQRLALAGLTMNLSILTLQDRLAVQNEFPSADQKAELKDHGMRSALLLRQLGFVDDAWLLAVAMHHHAHPLAPVPSVGALAPELAIRYRARLIHKVDVYAAKLSPRRHRPGVSATQAARAAFLDEGGGTDGVGTWLVKTMGLYPPGSLVKLRNGEAGVVRCRGSRTHAPWVAVVASSSGTPLHEPMLRDTGQDQHAVVQAVSPAQLRVRVPLEAVLALKPRPGTEGAASGGAGQAEGPAAARLVG